MKAIISNSFLLISLCIVCNSCRSGAETSISEPLSNKIVLIFQDCPPDINIFRWGSRGAGPYGGIFSNSDMIYADSAMALASTRIMLKKASYSDTITIIDDTQNKFIAVTHSYNLNENAYYLFHKGDTVLFTYKENIPYATILNRETSFHNSNYDIFIRENVTNNRVSAMSFYNFHVSVEKAKNEGMSENIIQLQHRQMIFLSEKEQILTKEQAFDIAIDEVMREHKLQDSLHNVGLLFDDEFNYRRFNLVSTVKNNFSQDSAFIKHPDIEKIIAETDLSAEKFAEFAHLQKLQQSQRELNEKVNDNLKDIKPNTISAARSGISYPNHIARFDTISNLDFLSVKSKGSFLSHELKGIFEYENINDIEKYSRKYLSITGDTLFVRNLWLNSKEINNIDFSENNRNNFIISLNMNSAKSAQLFLIDKNNRHTNLQEVLDKNKGKVIYLDFWASWCAPCLQSMPHAKVLREEYKDKDVAFIYLAFNDEEENWKAYEQKYEVDYLSESYFITNSKTAQIIADLDLKTVPRYLLFDKNGGLAHSNAPEPRGRVIREQLDKLLKE